MKSRFVGGAEALARRVLQHPAHHRDLEIANLLAQRVAVKAQHRGSFNLIAACCGQSQANQRALHFRDDPVVDSGRRRAPAWEARNCRRVAPPRPRVFQGWRMRPSFPRWRRAVPSPIISAVIDSSGHRAASRRMRFSSSRTLPGQACFFSRSTAPGSSSLQRQAFAVGALKEVAGEKRDVFHTLAQRREADRHHVQAIEQIFAEAAVLDRLRGGPDGWRR